MSLFDKDYTLEQLVQTAVVRNDKHLRQAARYICTCWQIDPSKDDMAPFIAGQLCDSNLDAVVSWLTSYLGTQQQMPMDIDLYHCEDAFRRMLLDRAPSHLLWRE